MNTKALDRAIKYIDSWLEFRYSHLEMPGFVVAIRHKNKLLFNKAYGLANLERKEALTINHLFRIASHSKTFTATAIMQLQEQGKLSIDDPAVKYVSWLREHSDKRWQEVTVRQLLSHSAGVIRDGLDCDYWAVERPFPNFEEFKKELLRADLVIDNNTKLKYSNYGYTLLGYVIKAASGEEYNKYVKHHIVDELELKNTGPEFDEALKDKYVTGYSRRDLDKQRLPIVNIDTRAMSAATGFYSTAEDLCEYAAAQFWSSDKLLNKESKKEMQRTHWSNKFADENEEYGLGFELEGIDERRVVGHGGNFPGQITKTFFDPKEELAVVVLTNCIDGSAKAINKGIIKLMDWLQKNSEEKSSHDLQRFEGRFMTLWTVIDVLAAGDKIVTVEPDSWELFKEAEELEYVDDKTLKIKKASSFSSEDELIHYEFDANGSAKKIVYAGATMFPEDDYLTNLKQTEIIGNNE